MSKRKLLLADDSVTIQKVVNLTFADEGIEVIAVGDGDTAMEMVAEISPDLIMADVNMPGLTGYEICERIRHDAKLSQTPVILLVGSFEPFDEAEARRVGADDYLTKPFQSIRQLVNKVTVLLNSHSNKNGDSNAEIQNASSLENTLEMTHEEVSATPENIQFTDNSYDDEMIQTNQPSSFNFDETQKFESRNTGELSEIRHIETQDISSNYKPYEIEVDEEFTEEPALKAETTDEPPIFTEEVEENEIFKELAESNKIEEEVHSDEIEERGLISEPGETLDLPQSFENEENLNYEIKDEENLLSAFESNNSTYELETSSGVSYELKNDEPVLDDFYPQTVNEMDDVADEAKPVIDEPHQDILYRIKDDQDNIDEIESEAPVSDEFKESKDKEPVSDELEEISNKEPVSDETLEKSEFADEEVASTNDSSEIKEAAIVSSGFDDIARFPKERIIHNVEPDTTLEVDETLEEEAKPITDEVEEVKTVQEEEIPLPETVSVLVDSDEDDILQLPPIELDLDEEPKVELKVESTVETVDDSDKIAALAATEPSTNVISPSQISEELIDFIVAKVLERLSEKVIKEVAWEVVPPMTELIVKKMAEDKLKD